jgi:hypothetical protein
MSELILPIVHLNGTSKDELIAQRRDAGATLRHALEALSEMAPNARDYYPTPGLFEKARAQSDRRIAAVRAVYKEIEEETIALDEAYD